MPRKVGVVVSVIAFIMLLITGHPALAETKGVLGVVFTNVPPGNWLLSQGALVAQVAPGGPAERGGLQPGDIVVMIDMTAVTDAQSAAALIGRHRAGDQLVLSVVNQSGGGFNQRSVVVTLAAAPGAPPADEPRPAPDPMKPDLRLPEPRMPVVVPPAARQPVVRQPEIQPPAQPVPQPPAQQPPAPQAPAAGGELALRPLQAGLCTAQVPPGWQATGQAPDGSNVTFAAPDGTVRASYGVATVDPARFGDPADYARYVTGAVFGAGVSSPPPQALPDGLHALVWQTQTGLSGYTLFGVHKVPERGYVISLYIGGGPAAEFRRMSQLAAVVAATTRCRTWYVPPAPAGFRPQNACLGGGGCVEGDAALEAILRMTAQ